MSLNKVPVDIGRARLSSPARGRPTPPSRIRPEICTPRSSLRSTVVPIQPSRRSPKKQATSSYRLVGGIGDIWRKYGADATGAQTFPSSTALPVLQFGYSAAPAGTGSKRQIGGCNASTPNCRYARSEVRHQHAWPRSCKLRDQLEQVRRVLAQYLDILALVPEAPPQARHPRGPRASSLSCANSPLLCHVPATVGGRR